MLDGFHRPYDENTLAGIAKHYQTGAPLPADLYSKLMAARTYRRAHAAVRVG